MSDNRFFTFLRHFNTLAFSVAALGALVLVGIGGWNILKSSKSTSDSSAVAVQKFQTENVTWQFGDLMSVADSGIAILPLNMKLGSSSLSTYSNNKTITANYLFLDTEKNTQKWLLSHNDFTFVKRLSLPTRHYLDKDSKDTEAYYFEVVQNDTNNDGKQNSADLISIALARVDGTGFTILIDGIESILGTQALTGGNILVIYEKNGKGFAATVDFDRFKLIENKELPKVG